MIYVTCLYQAAWLCNSESPTHCRIEGRAMEIRIPQYRSGDSAYVALSGQRMGSGRDAGKGVIGVIIYGVNVAGEFKGYGLGCGRDNQQ